MGNYKILFTTKKGSEEKALYEIGDLLYIHDNRVKLEKTDFPGTIILYTNLNPAKTYRLIIVKTTSYVLRIVPDLGKENSKKIAQTSIPKKINIRCETRGSSKQVCEEIENELNMIPGVILTTKKKAEIIFHVETVYKQTFYSIMPKDCDNISKILVDPRQKRKCIDFMKKIEKYFGGGAPHGSGGWI